MPFNIHFWFFVCLLRQFKNNVAFNILSTPVLQKNVFEMCLFMSLEMVANLSIVADWRKLFFLITNVFEYEVTPRGCQVHSKF